MDIYEKLPVPFGLVRFGVAPDHPEVKVTCSFLFCGGNKEWNGKGTRGRAFSGCGHNGDVEPLSSLRKYYCLIYILNFPLSLGQGD